MVSRGDSEGSTAHEACHALIARLVPLGARQLDERLQVAAQHLRKQPGVTGRVHGADINALNIITRRTHAAASPVRTCDVAPTTRGWRSMKRVVSRRASAGLAPAFSRMRLASESLASSSAFIRCSVSTI